SNLADLLKPAKTSTASVKRFLYPHPQHVNTKSTHHDKFLTDKSNVLIFWLFSAEFQFESEDVCLSLACF
ncbi:hypothetical protein, partial [Acetobacter indonesiensis]|uniref:hypothetical protein n=1 Tax=Acetobacter indonesiensis TaxID=104101 RepID=UPI00223274BA